ncbi:MAG: type I polyketide synthase, partial [Nitrococcus sp.]|nr:type I polyketide synthase [Nitrococcus sp.]
QAGDQAEISALSRVFGAARDEPCLIGSAKPNVGHLEAGAGVVGLIKAVLAIKNGVIPPSVHSELNDQIDWKAANLRVVSTPTAWPQSLNPRRVGISCFGVGGVISHTIIEEAPADPTEERYGPSSAHTDVERPTLFPLSARSQASLMANARQLATWIEEHPEIGRSSIGHTMSNRRDHLSKRAAIIASSREQLISGLIAVANGDESANAVVGDVSGDAQKGAVWVFSGHGAQWEGMAKELLERSTVFAETIDALGPTFQRELGYTAREAILESDWSTVERIQALTFAVQVALARVWQSLGLHPGAVIGHSVGEVAAAVVSGALDVNDAALFACRRAAIYQRLAGKGAMAIARVPFEEAQRKLHGNDHVVAAIAASPSATVISGDTNALKSVIADWKKERLVVKRVATIDAAFHSPQIDCLLGDIRDAAAHLATQRPSIPLYTTTLTDPRSSEDRGAEFWALNSRGAVLLVGAVTAALQDGFTAFLEVSTAPIVAPSIRETIDDVAGDDITVLATLAPNKPEMDALLTSLGKLFTAGCPVDWSTLHPAGDVVPLPTQSWQHRNFWPVAIVTSNVKGFGHSPKSHTLLGQAEHVRSSPPLTVWRTQLERSTRPYPGSHPLFGVE